MDNTMTRIHPELDFVTVGGLPVADLTQIEVIDELADSISKSGFYSAFALHVGGLVARTDTAYQKALAGAGIVYADGVSVVMLARAGGARRIERSPTTDVAIPAMKKASEELHRPLRLVLIGGADGLAAAAAIELVANCPVDVLKTTHGFHDDWRPILAEIRLLEPDLIMIGLGAPSEMIWTDEHRQFLPECTVMTCGGWFGFLAGVERRAAPFYSQNGFEWMVRLVQQPRRLGPRYVRGAMASAQILAGTILHQGGAR